ncbi:cupredoxin domain-containing protein [Streptodolium elevatio]|uniref:Cupredoxin domain-containing protein n=1 Tax=Streptodolium elevatio TaxID=3157996 RepID=A0ABV3DDC8_9ACTN
MNRTTPRSGTRRRRQVVGLLVPALLVLVTACSSSSDSSDGSSTSPAAPPSTAPGSVVPPPATGQVVLTISQFDFAPKPLTVAPGAVVTVVNKDDTPHTATAVKDKAFNTGTIEGGQTGTFTAPTTPGTYNYICTIHQFMTGTLIVS